MRLGCVDFQLNFSSAVLHPVSDGGDKDSVEKSAAPEPAAAAEPFPFDPLQELRVMIKDSKAELKDCLQDIIYIVAT